MNSYWTKNKYFIYIVLSYRYGIAKPLGFAMQNYPSAKIFQMFFLYVKLIVSIKLRKSNLYSMFVSTSHIYKYNCHAVTEKNNKNSIPMYTKLTKY